MFTRNLKFIRISSNGLCDEVFKERLFTRDPHNVFQATIYFTWKLHEDYLPYAFLYLSKCGKGASDILFQEALEVPTTVCRGGKQVSFFYIPFLTCFLTFHFTSAYSLVPFDLNFSFVTVAFFCLLRGMVFWA